MASATSTRQKCPLSGRLAIIVAIILVIVAIIYFLKNIKMSEGFFDGRDDDYHLVMFKADWCPHCREALPTYKEVMSAANGAMVGTRKLYFDIIDPELDNERVDVSPGGDRTMNVKMKTTYSNDKIVSLSGFPTYLLFRGDREPVRYSGPLERNAIIAFAGSQV